MKNTFGSMLIEAHEIQEKLNALEGIKEILVLMNEMANVGKNITYNDLAHHHKKIYEAAVLLDKNQVLKADS